MKNDDHKWDNKHPTAQMLGRWQPWHAGHQKLFEETLKNINTEIDINKKSEAFDEQAQKEFINGAKIAYETIITDFSDNDNKLTTSKPLLNKEIYNQFNEALLERKSKGHYHYNNLRFLKGEAVFHTQRHHFLNLYTQKTNTTHD